MTDREMLERIHSEAEPMTQGGLIPMDDDAIAGYRLGCPLWDELEAHLYPEDGSAVNAHDALLAAAK